MRGWLGILVASSPGLQTCPANVVPREDFRSGPYSDSCQATVERNRREQIDDARPAIVDPLAAIDAYDTILGIPAWSVRAPMIVRPFAERFDFTSTVVYPSVTYPVRPV